MSQPTTQTEIFRRMSPAQKLDAAMRLYWSARELKAAALRARNPSWDDAQVQRAVSHAFLYARG